MDWCANLYAIAPIEAAEGPDGRIAATEAAWTRPYPYTYEEKFASGAFGTVWRVQSQEDGQTYVAKHMQNIELLDFKFLFEWKTL